MPSLVSHSVFTYAKWIKQIRVLLVITETERDAHCTSHPQVAIGLVTLNFPGWLRISLMDRYNGGSERIN